jgi:hypothetical protein
MRFPIALGSATDRVCLVESWVVLKRDRHLQLFASPPEQCAGGASGTFGKFQKSDSLLPYYLSIL